MVIRCIFTGNSAPGSLGGGGAIYILGALGESDPIVVNTSFIGNSGRKGGAIDASGSRVNATFVNCLFSGNSAEFQGGAIYSSVAAVDGMTLINCTLSGNSSGTEGGGVSLEGGQTIIKNCILWDNSPDQISVSGGFGTVSFSDVQGGLPVGVIDGGGNIGDNPADNPLFVDPVGPDGMPGTEDDDLQLSAGSPCIDAANNADLVCDEFDVDEDGLACLLGADEATPALGLTNLGPTD